MGSEWLTDEIFEGVSMPTDTNLPVMVHLYFETMNKLNDFHSEFDSSSPEHKIFEEEIKYYLGLIRQELIAAKEQEDKAYRRKL